VYENIVLYLHVGIYMGIYIALLSKAKQKRFQVNMP